MNGVDGNRDSFDHRRMVEGKRLRQTIQDPGGYGHVFRESAVPPVVAARNSQNLPVVAQVDVTGLAECARPATDGGIERDPVVPFFAVDGSAIIGTPP